MNRTSCITTMLIVALSMNGCVSSGKKPSKAKQFSVQGCAAGGLGAGLLAFAATMGDKKAEEKIAIASVLGCLAGAVTGYHLGKRTEQYASAQQAAEEEIALNRSNTENLRNYNLQVAENIKTYKTQVARIRSSTLNQSDKRKNLRKANDIMLKQRRKARESLGDLNQEIIKAENQFRKYQQDADANSVSRWKAELDGLQQEQLILAGHVDTLNALDSSI